MIRGNLTQTSLLRTAKWPKAHVGPLFKASLTDCATHTCFSEFLSKVARHCLLQSVVAGNILYFKHQFVCFYSSKFSQISQIRPHSSTNATYGRKRFMMFKSLPPLARSSGQDKVRREVLERLLLYRDRQRYLGRDARLYDY